MIKNSEDVHSPVSQRLVDLIERHADELTKQYLREVKLNVRLPAYGSFNEGELYDRAYRVYSHLGKWISQEINKEEFKCYWKDLGKQRRSEGFPLSEIILSLCILRAQLWQKVESEGLLDTALDLYQAMELNHRVIAFFDRAIYCTTCGYEEQD